MDAHVPCHGSEITLCYQCDAKLSTVSAMSAAMQLIHNATPNFELSTSDKTSICHSISELHYLLDQHDFELRRLKHVIAFLSTSHEALSRRIEDVKSLVAPMHSLPDEVLSEIFRIHFTSSMDEIKHRSYGRIHIPIEFTHVCSRWRNVALTSPRIWTDITFTDTRSAFVVDLTRMFLERSACAPLKVKFSLSSSTAQLLCAQTARWVDADVSIDERQLHGRFPLLKHVILQGGLAQTWRSHTDSDPLPAVFLKDASKLCDLQLNIRDRLSASEMSQAIQLPWSQIRTLVCSHSMDNVQSLLSLCTNVEDVSCRTRTRIMGHLDATEPDARYSCPSLRRLTLNTGPEVRSLFDHLDAPSLTHLELTWNVYSLEPFNDGIVPFLTRSRCQLTTLSLNNTPFSSKKFVELFAVTPSLISLSLDFESSSYPDSLARLFVELQFKSGNTIPLLPALKRLKLAHLKWERPEVDSLLIMLESRLPEMLEKAHLQPEARKLLSCLDKVDVDNDLFTVGYLSTSEKANFFRLFGSAS